MFPCLIYFLNIASNRGGNWDLHSEQAAKQKCYARRDQTDRDIVNRG